LRDRFPGTRFEVVNAAMTGINSHVALPIARETAPGRMATVWVIYMGNNEGGGAVWERDGVRATRGESCFDSRQPGFPGDTDGANCLASYCGACDRESGRARRNGREWRCS